ncbi:hypothetical protein [Pseudomarimonas arenosa]|uniref:DUF7933 domain-containing protein n=1 Tax=Pseudomarimonas arenosa TaxID=2774145 RepID=A0AAW3ZJK5_9GAMM|nr:hypothetical protein [Pseudomarimonas arenosa]MBD8525399.1 hypothetical protein [Pseudomarimonas arenosa]
MMLRTMALGAVLLGASSVVQAGLPSCSATTAFTGSNTQMGRIFRDAIPSSCPSKAYPGIFNPGTTYNYEAFTFTNSGGTAQCVTVNFDPNPDNNLATDCDTNAHASLYVGSYDPTNQSANYVGDVGSSITDSFSAEVPAMSSLILVVTNTSAQEICNFAYEMQNIPCAVVGTPPLFSVAVSPSPLPANVVGTVTFTINNSANGVPANSLAFSNTFPTGMTLSAQPNGNSSCGGTVTAAAGGTTLSLTGGTVAAGASCTVSANVVATTAGILSISSGDLTSNLGNSGPAAGTVSVGSSAAVIPTMNGFGLAILTLLMGFTVVLVSRRS